MRYTKITLTISLLVCFSLTTVHAKQGIVSARSDISETGSTVSFPTEYTDFYVLISDDNQDNTSWQVVDVGETINLNAALFKVYPNPIRGVFPMEHHHYDSELPATAEVCGMLYNNQFLHS